MYSGTTLTKNSGRFLGAHQKFDRVARRDLAELLPDNSLFPSAKNILHFEGKNGPDAIKRKSPAKDELWHYFNPFDPKDTQILKILNDHYTKLVVELKSGNKERTAFEAAWLAHAVVDGLTPAHHYPYEEKLVELRGGQGIETRTTVKEKWVLPGDTRRQQLHNNWKMWGARGLFTSHFLFEMGVATIVKPLSLGSAEPTPEDIINFRELGLEESFTRIAKEIAVMDIYHRYCRKGWTPKLARQVRKKLAPTIVKTLTLAWYSAMIDAGLVKEPKRARN